ncbi:MAG: type III-A CRISPR-associated RAMP protein Csm3 [Rhodocyclales bacterium]|nr:type III-A CRISPR-associated RAMP protein Csm3 [Rhodocyclales bacterium]
MPQLTGITTLEATLELLTGLRIGAGDAEMHIGGVDNTVIKHPHTQEPYIPGSSLKGKMRSLLEWRSGEVQAEPLGIKQLDTAPAARQAEVRRILQLFGVGGGDFKENDPKLLDLGPSRLAFWDCALCPEWVQEISNNNQMLLEVKSENRINRLSGVAEHPRNTERVPAGARFKFRLSLRQLAGDDAALLDTVLQGLKLIEFDSLGGSGSRGYGKVRFSQLTINGTDASARFAQTRAFPEVA